MFWIVSGLWPFDNGKRVQHKQLLPAQLSIIIERGAVFQDASA
jgi:hypothetical protein